MKLKIDNASISQLFSLVSSISAVKASIEKQELVLVQVDEELAELRKEAKETDATVAHKAQLLRDGSQSGLQELLHLQWLQQESQKGIASAEMRKSGLQTSLSLLDDELVSLQREIDAVLEGRKV